MRAFILTILTTISVYSYCQTDYNKLLSTRLDQIRNEKIYYTGVVIFADTSVHRFGFPIWSPKEAYYLIDMAQINGKLYEAIADSVIGKNPETSPNEWKLSEANFHPYFFLRDTAKIEDLRRLIKDKHPYVRTYSFASLVHRNQDNLFQIILDNLKDTTKIETIASDVVENEYVPDVMISYCYKRLDSRQKDKLKKLISTKYKYLKGGLYGQSEN